MTINKLKLKSGLINEDGVDMKIVKIKINKNQKFKIVAGRSFPIPCTGNRITSSNLCSQPTSSKSI